MKRKFTGHNRIFFGLSCAIILVALIMQICGAGLNLGIDFTGGSILEYSVGESYDISDVETILASVGYGDVTPTKAEPSEASIALQEQLAASAQVSETAEDTAIESVDDTGDTEAEEAEAAEETAETEESTEIGTTEETAETEEATESEETEETEETASLLNPDKSNIEEDSRTDLIIRLPLVDETEGMDTAVESAVNGTLVTYTQLNYQSVTERGLDTAYIGDYMFEFDMGAEVDTASLEAAVSEALADYPVSELIVTAYDPEAEAAEAEDAEETAEAEETEETEETAETAESDETAEADETSETEEAEETAEAEDAEETESTGTYARIIINIDDATTRVRTVLEREMTAKYPNFRFVSIDHVSAVAGRDLISNAVKALLIAFACMLVYIAIRFDFLSGCAALLALCHDVLVMVSFMIFFRGVFQANSSFIAAILTIVGYSINNTIVIFDRIRENVKMPGSSSKSREDIVEESVSSTLTRTMNTTITTLITLVCLYIFGVTAIRQFAFPLIVGMLAGTYSSIFISGQVWAIWRTKADARKAAKKASKKASKKGN